MGGHLLRVHEKSESLIFKIVFLVIHGSLLVSKNLIRLVIDAHLTFESDIAGIIEVIHSYLPYSHFLIITDGSDIEETLFSNPWMQLCSINETGMVNFSDEEKSIIVLIIEPVTIFGLFICKIPDLD